MIVNTVQWRSRCVEDIMQGSEWCIAFAKIVNELQLGMGAELPHHISLHSARHARMFGDASAREHAILLLVQLTPLQERRDSNTWCGGILFIIAVAGRPIMPSHLWCAESDLVPCKFQNNQALKMPNRIAVLIACMSGGAIRSSTSWCSW